MVNISGQQSCQRRCIFPRATAAGLMSEKFNAIDILKDPALTMVTVGLRRLRLTNLFYFSFAVLANQFSNLLTINLRSSKTELLFERLLQNCDVSVFTKDKGNDQPIISRSYLTIRAMVSSKSLLLPAGHIRRM